jgi:AraC-like DNA-binding protein
VGQSLTSVIRKARVQRGCALLCESDLSLAEVADAAGFFDQSHFTRVFRQYTGTTPGAYRRLCRECGC